MTIPFISLRWNNKYELLLAALSHNQCCTVFSFDCCEAGVEWTAGKDFDWQIPDHGLNIQLIRRGPQAVLIGAGGQWLRTGDELEVKSPFEMDNICEEGGRSCQGNVQLNFRLSVEERNGVLSDMRDHRWRLIGFHFVFVGQLFHRLQTNTILNASYLTIFK